MELSLKVTMESYLKAIKNWSFAGRSRRAEYLSFWWYNSILCVALYFMARAPGLASRGWLMRHLSGIFFFFFVALVIPATCLGVRRLHDIGKSGWWYPFGPIFGTSLLCCTQNIGGRVVQWIMLITAVGFMILQAPLWVREGNSGANAFGPDPKAAAVQPG